MPIARWKDLCIDATDAHRMARFWGGLLGLTIELHDDGDAALRGATPEETIWINAVPEPRTVKQRVHLDIEGGELCAFVRHELPAAPPARLYEMNIDTQDTKSAKAQARWWAGVLGGQVVDDERGFSWIEDVPGLATSVDPPARHAGVSVHRRCYGTMVFSSR